MSKPDSSDIEASVSLVRRAQSGDEMAFSKLFGQYSPLIDSVCARYLSDAPSEQELRSEAIAAFWSAIRSYDLGQQQNVTFGLYAQICLSNRMISCIRKWKRIKPMLSLDSDCATEVGADAESNPAHYVVEQEKYLELRHRMELLLSPKERQVWMLFIEGHTANEIADKLGTEKKDVENAVFRARKKLRQHIPPPKA